MDNGYRADCWLTELQLRDLMLNTSQANKELFLDMIRHAKLKADDPNFDAEIENFICNLNNKLVEDGDLELDTLTGRITPPSGPYKQLKVFGYRDLPNKAKSDLHDNFEQSKKDFYEINVHDTQKPMTQHKGGEILHESNLGTIGTFIVERGDSPLCDWLFDNGAKRNEKVLIAW